MVPLELLQASLYFPVQGNRSDPDCVSRGSSKPGGGASGYEITRFRKDGARPMRRKVMIDHSESPQPAPERDDQALDEARLRQQAIGVKLRQMFDQVVNEAVPDDFLEILRRADEKSKGGS